MAHDGPTAPLFVLPSCIWMDEPLEINNSRSGVTVGGKRPLSVLRPSSLRDRAKGSQTSRSRKCWRRGSDASAQASPSQLRKTGRVYSLSERFAADSLCARVWLAVGELQILVVVLAFLVAGGGLCIAAAMVRTGVHALCITTCCMSCWATQSLAPLPRV